MKNDLVINKCETCNFNLPPNFLLFYVESSIHNNVMHDCNRHRKHGYMDKTWLMRIPDEFIDEF